jgi:hypothetical protein
VKKAFFRFLQTQRRRFLKRFWKKGRRRWVLLVAGLLLFLAYLILTQPEDPPRQPNDLCAVFEERPHWYKSTRKAAKKWGVPPAVQMAVIHQESSFRARIRPPRRWILWIIPGPRPSTAYGYTQALDSTWREFQRETGRSGARRDRFADAAHFMGWYGREIHQITGIAKDDAYRLYLAYHEGPGGFLEGRHHQKAWLLDVARQVEARARKYQRQLDACADDLRGPFPWLWVLLTLLVAGGVGWWWRRRPTSRSKSKSKSKPKPKRRRRH